MAGSQAFMVLTWEVHDCVGEKQGVGWKTTPRRVRAGFALKLCILHYTILVFLLVFARIRSTLQSSRQPFVGFNCAVNCR